jgi:adenylate cyclase
VEYSLLKGFTEHKTMFRLAGSPGLGIFVAVAGLLVYFGLFGFDLEENLGLDLMIRAQGQKPAPSEVIVVNLDKASANRLGLPVELHKWPRTVHAQLVDRLAGAGASVIAFDVYFKEARSKEEDHALASAISRAGNVILYAYLQRDALDLSAPMQIRGRTVNVERLLAPTADIASSAVASAPFALPKSKIKVSQFWTFRRSAGDTPTLPAIVLQFYALDAYDDFMRLLREVNPEAADELPISKQEILLNQGLPGMMDRLKALFVEWPGLGSSLLDRLHSNPGLVTDPDVRRRLVAMIQLYRAGNLYYLNFYGPPYSITTIASADILHKVDPPLDLTGKAVFIGQSEGFQPNQTDGFYTVYSQSNGLDISGVEIAATAFANLLAQTSIRPLDPLLFMALIVGYGLVAATMSRRSSALRSIGLSVLLAAAYGVLSFTAFQTHQLWLPVAVPLLIQSPLALVLGLALGHWEANQERNRVRQAFGHYLPDKAVDKLLRASGPLHTHHELQYGICLATDAEQYTRLAESMAPDALQTYMNRYYQVLFEPVRAHAGVVSDVIGDAMLAIWSAPESDINLRAQACHAAVEIARNVDRFNAGNDARLPTRIGLHAGVLALGNLGAMDHFEYRAVGDIVNTASRIEGVNKTLNTGILVSQAVMEGITGFVTRELGSFRLVGKQQPVVLHELLGHSGELDLAMERLLQNFARGLAAYRNQAWQQAVAIFEDILQTAPADGPAGFYLELCKQYALQPPQAWDPVVYLDRK